MSTVSTLSTRSSLPLSTQYERKNLWKTLRWFAHRSLNISTVERLKLAEDKKIATDESMIPKNVKARAAEAITSLAEQELEASEAGKKVLDLHNKQVKNNSNDEKSTRSGSKALPSFLALPVELHLQIILNIAHSIDPGLVNLREVNKYFQSIVSPADLHTWGTTLLKNKQFKAADRLYGLLGVEDRLPCTLCQCLLPMERFHMQAKQGKKALGHKLVCTFRNCPSNSVSKFASQDKIREQNHLSIPGPVSNLRFLTSKKHC